MMGRTWTFLALLAMNGFGCAGANAECGQLSQQLAVLRRKSAEDDSRIANLESRLARAERQGAERLASSQSTLLDLLLNSTADSQRRLLQTGDARTTTTTCTPSPGGGLREHAARGTMSPVDI